MTHDCLPSQYQVNAVIPVVVKVTADSRDEAERAAMSQMANIRIASVFADVAIGFPMVVEVTETGDGVSSEVAQV